jgi:phospholipid/cholesterol/gamma-HCH transport system ATP-binding protein
MALIELRNLHKRFGRLVVLNGVSLAVEEGQSLVVIGASGSGKSVMLKHIVGLLKPDRGEVWVDGQRIDDYSEREMDAIRQQFGFLFQMGALFDSLNVEENVAFPLVEHTRKGAVEIATLVSQKLAMVGLDGTQKKMPGELSGGQRKRVALARAVALGPRVILYDEPTTGLDPIMADVINDLIVKCVKDLGATALSITHDMASARKIADRIAMIYKGKIIWSGPVSQIDNSGNPYVDQFIHGRADGPIQMEVSQS